MFGEKLELGIRGVESALCTGLIWPYSRHDSVGPGVIREFMQFIGELNDAVIIGRLAPMDGFLHTGRPHKTTYLNLHPLPLSAFVRVLLNSPPLRTSAKAERNR